ncbi:hypothetical protein C8F04DRAFT_1399383 [Mycena alexandri]|uniref:Uncharacterized protein n=1 Tax=Mycena alexandri TaxID=1745969 RepID=A0AAD6SHQ9_9AGAR|nr:hypothetical protein C8F04DRAFT_1399383 [Mycena alexandri]
MSLHLGPRSHCAAKNCDCTVLFSEDSSGHPQYTNFASSEVSCAGCGHTWIVHGPDPAGVSRENQPFVRGGAGDGDCGAFHSMEVLWNMRLHCLCSRKWSVHDRPSEFRPRSILLPTERVVPAQSSGSMVSPQRPALAYSGSGRRAAPAVRDIHPPTSTAATTVQRERRASILRTLPQHQSSGSSSGSSPSRKKPRLAGNPRAYSTPVAALNDFSPSSSHLDVPQTVQITVGILPKVLSTSDNNDVLDLSPVYFWKTGDELEAVQRRLETAKLTFRVDANPTGPVFETINDGFIAHCALQNIVFVTPSPVLVNGVPISSPNSKPWVLTGPKGRVGNRSWVEDPKCLTAFTFTIAALRASPYSNTSNYLGEGIFIFIAPRCRNLIAAIDCLFTPAAKIPLHVLSHRCFSARVLYPILASLGDDPTPTCRPSCTRNAHNSVEPRHRHVAASPAADFMELARPLSIIDSDDSEDDIEFPETNALLTHMIRETVPLLDIQEAQPMDPTPEVDSVSPAPILTRAASRRLWHGEPQQLEVSSTPPFVAGPLLISLMDSAPLSVKSRSFSPGGAIDLTLHAAPGAGAHSLAAWQAHISGIHGVDDAVISLKASSVDEGARALVAFCIWVHSVRQPPAVKFKEILQEQFPSPRPTMEGPMTEIALLSLRVKIGPGFGKGPRTEVLTRALEIVVADKLHWTDCGEYKTIRLHPSISAIPRRSAVLKGAGLILLLHYLHVGAPFYVSPFLLWTIFNGRQTASRFDLEFLTRFISRDTLAYIERFHSTPLNVPMYAEQTPECVEYQYLLNIPSMDPTLISRSRTQEEHDGVCTTIISFLTLGTVDIRHQSDFICISDGFNVALEPFGTYDQFHHILEWFKTPCRELIMFSYDLRIKAVSDVLSNITYTQANSDLDPWRENLEIVELIKKFICHYISEPGHPNLPGGIVGALGFDAGNNDPLVRARLIMTVMTGSPLLPVEPLWSLKVTIIHDWDNTYPCYDADGVENCGPEATASFQSCFKTVAITNNARLRQMLLAEKPGEGRDTAFGEWFHGQALSSRQAYSFA